jgi:hypothetical protein
MAYTAITAFFFGANITMNVAFMACSIHGGKGSTTALRPFIFFLLYPVQPGKKHFYIERACFPALPLEAFPVIIGSMIRITEFYAEQQRRRITVVALISYDIFSLVSTTILMVGTAIVQL